MERTVLTTSLSGSALMDPFFILHCLKDTNRSSKAEIFLSEGGLVNASIPNENERKPTAFIAEIKNPK